MPTIVAGSALDIVQYCGAPRYLFTDFPLGNPTGKPEDSQMQQAIVQQALGLLERAQLPRTTEVTPFAWGDGRSWRTSYAQVTAGNAKALQALGEARRARRSQLQP